MPWCEEPRQFRANPAEIVRCRTVCGRCVFACAREYLFLSLCVRAGMFVCVCMSERMCVRACMCVRFVLHACIGGWGGGLLISNRIP